MFVNELVNYFTGVKTHERESTKRTRIDESDLDSRAKAKAKFYSWCNEILQIGAGRVLPNLITFGGLIAFKDEPLMAAYAVGLGEAVRNAISLSENKIVESIAPELIVLETKEEKLHKAIKGKLSSINKEEFAEIL